MRRDSESHVAGRVSSGWLGLFCFNRLCNQLNCPVLLTWIDFNCLVFTQEKRQRSAVCAAEENRNDLLPGPGLADN